MTVDRQAHTAKRRAGLKPEPEHVHVQRRIDLKPVKRVQCDDEDFVYSRYGNPTVSMFEERLAQLDGSEACFATASGMSALFVALLCQLQSGDHVVSSRALFGSCHYILTQLLPRYGIKVELVARQTTPMPCRTLPSCVQPEQACHRTMERWSGC